MRPALLRPPCEHPYHRLRAIPAASRPLSATRHVRDDGPQVTKGQKESSPKNPDASDTKKPTASNEAPSSQTTNGNRVPGEPKERSSTTRKPASSSKVHKSGGSSSSANTSFDELGNEWEDNPNLNISQFSELPHSNFGVNQHIKINDEFKEALRMIPWQFRAPVRYAFAYGSGVFPQSKSDGRLATAEEIARVHPKAPPGVQKAQDGTPKMIDFIFGVTYTQHWHSLNINQHRDHYSALASLGSAAVSYVQDRMGAGVYFNTHVVVNGILVKYGVVNIDTLCRDLTEWDTLYLAGRLHKPVKILRDDARVRLANQMNLLSALRTALLLLPERFTELELYNTVAGISYLGDPRMTLPTENPHKVSNIVGNNLANFQRLYSPLIDNLPNASFDDGAGAGRNRRLAQDMDPVRRGNMVRRLPKAFRSKLYFQYQRKFAIPQAEFDAMMGADRDAESVSSVNKKKGSAGAGGGFETRIAQDDPAALTRHVRRVIKNTIGWPSTTQSLKGLLTGGVRKSFGYVWEKVEKYRDGARKKAAAAPAAAAASKEEKEAASEETKADASSEEAGKGSDAKPPKEKKD